MLLLRWRQNWQFLVPGLGGEFRVEINKSSTRLRSLFRKNSSSELAKALMNLGSIIKTLYLLNYIDSEEYQRHILI